MTIKGGNELSQQCEGNGKPLRQYIIAVLINMCMFCFGLTAGWTSPIQQKLEDPEQTPLEEPISPAEMSWLASLLSVAGIFVPYVAAGTVDRFGRKVTMLVCFIPFIIGWIIIALANNVALLFTARLFQSVGMCIMMAADLIYISEIATDEARGAITSMVHLFITLGILVMFSFGPFVSYHVVAYIMIGVCIPYFIILWFIPESPNYYVLKGNDTLAKKSLMIIRGRNEEDIEVELHKIKIRLESKMSEVKATFSDLWLSKAHVMSLVIASALFVIQQLSGQQVVMFYMMSILAAAGSSVEPAIASIIVAAIQFFSSLLVPFIVERFGRKVLLIISLSGVAISLCVLGTYFKLQIIDESQIEGFEWVPLLTLVTFIISYCLGIGPLVWTIAGEIFPANIKTLATSISTSINYASAFVVALTFSLIQEAAGAHVPFWICCGATVIGLIFVCTFLPETKQKTLQQIEESLNR